MIWDILIGVAILDLIILIIIIYFLNKKAKNIELRHKKFRDEIPY